jgi:hypothetical protein
VQLQPQRIRLDEAPSASNPPDFFYDGARRHEWTLPPATVSVCPYEAMYAEEVKAEGYLDNDKRRALTLEFFQSIERDCGSNLIFYYANYSNPFLEEEAPRYVLTGVSRIVKVGKELFYEKVSEEIANRYAGGMIWARDVSAASYLVGNTASVQTHTILDKTIPCAPFQCIRYCSSQTTL